MIGSALMPTNFSYRDVLARGYPEHDRYDRFRLKHPAMAHGQRAKIFSPFDALNGFHEAIEAKELLYENRREPEEEELQELNRRLMLLRSFTTNGRMARRNRVTVSVVFYLPCQDAANPDSGYRGQYVSVTGTVQRFTVNSIVIDETSIMLSDIVSIESDYEITDPDTGEKRRIFENPWYE